MENNKEKNENAIDNLSLMDCYLYAACGIKAIVENGMVTGFAPEEE